MEEHKPQRPNPPAEVSPIEPRPSDSDDPKTGYETTVPPRPKTGDDNKPDEKPADGGKSAS